MISLIPRYLEKGLFARYWYRDNLIYLKELFPGHDINVLVNILAATSPRTSLSSNVNFFIRAYSQYHFGLPFTGYMKNTCINLERIRKGEPISGRKISNFSRAMLGDHSAVTVDLWMMRIWEMENSTNLGRPTDKNYSFIEEEIRKIALENNFLPAEVQSMLWIGIRRHNGFFDITFADYIRRHIHSLFPLFSDEYFGTINIQSLR